MYECKSPPDARPEEHPFSSWYHNLPPGYRWTRTGCACIPWLNPQPVRSSGRPRRDVISRRKRMHFRSSGKPRNSRPPTIPTNQNLASSTKRTGLVISLTPLLGFGTDPRGLVVPGIYVAGRSSSSGLPSVSAEVSNLFASIRTASSAASPFHPNFALGFMHNVSKGNANTSSTYSTHITEYRIMVHLRCSTSLWQWVALACNPSILGFEESGIYCGRIYALLSFPTKTFTGPSSTALTLVGGWHAIRRGWAIGLGMAATRETFSL